MADKWVGKSVSIHCRDDIGVFQGIIKRVSPTEVVITKAVRNGIPLKKNNVEVSLSSRDIVKFELILCSNVPSIPLKPVATVAANSGQVTSLDDQFEGMTLLNNGKQQSQQKQQNQQQQQQQAQSTAQFQNGTESAFKLASKSPVSYKHLANNTPQGKGAEKAGSGKSTSHPIDISGPASKSNHAVASSSSVVMVGSFGNGRPVPPMSQSLPYVDGSSAKKTNGTNGKVARYRKNLAKDSTFGSPDDDPLLMDEEFDFEKNLALFDKQAIWNEIDAIQTRQAATEGGEKRQRPAPNSAAKTKYRHDENVLSSTPAQYRQIEIECPATALASQEYVTDEGLVIPSVPATLRQTVEQLADSKGLSRERQYDFLARGATELALQLLGGSRRLTPNNQHQWPKILVVCDGAERERMNEVGFSTARQLACHGLETLVFVSTLGTPKQLSAELPLYMATGNQLLVDLSSVPPCDLVIASVTTAKLGDRLRSWITNSRAPVLAIDPPVTGLRGISIKCSILPILPVNGIANDACGRLYLCNIGIPNQFFSQAGISYKSPFDKFVIPIHRRKEE